MAPVNNGLVWVSWLNQLTDEWQQRELIDVSILVAKLFSSVLAAASGLLE